MPQVTKKRQMTYHKSRRRINSKFLILIAILALVIIGVIKIPKFISDQNLKALGYTPEAISKIYEYDLDKELIDQSFYTVILDKNIQKANFNKTYLHLFSIKEEVSEDDILLYDRLRTKGYTEAQTISLFEKLVFYEITPLLVFDYQTDLTLYIEDCEAHRAENSADYFNLTNEYRVLYDKIEAIPDVKDYAMNVSKTYYLPEDFVPEKLVPLSLTYASSNVTMENEAAGQFMKMCDALINADLKMYATNAYRSYSYQVELYNDYVADDGKEKADTYVARPGFSEHQTGLTIDVASMKGGISDFSESKEYPWMSENAHLYGFIQRYPNNKTLITGYREESWHWRYIGVELATKVKESKLTYDEYYELYLKRIPTATNVTE